MSVSASPIEWTDATWGPTRGCSRVSEGCEHCYAERQANRFKGKGQPYEGLVRLSKKGPVWTGKVRLVPEQLAIPIHWKKPRRIFVDSMSDLFHERLTNEEIAAVFGVMAACPQHTFQILTKRATRMREWFEWHRTTCNEMDGGWEPWRLCESAAMEHVEDLPAIGCESRWPLDNVWLGVSAENQEYANLRLPELVKTPARVRFVSYEPALGPIDLSIWMYHGVDEARPGDDDYDAINWVIVGGESGPGSRPFNVAWARSVVEQCKKAGIACFVKQMGHYIIGDAEGFPTVHHWIRRSDDKRGLAPLIGPLVGKRPPNQPEDFGFRLCDSKGGDASEWPKDLRVRTYPKVERATW